MDARYLEERAMRLPQNPFHPGEMVLEEFLAPGKMTQAALAQKLGWTRARLNELIKGKRDITADSALDLARVLGTSAKLWMNLQATFDPDKAMRRRKIACRAASGCVTWKELRKFITADVIIRTVMETLRMSNVLVSDL